MSKQVASLNKALADMVGSVNSDLTTSDKLQILVTIAPRALAARGCSLLLLDAHRRRLIHAAAHGISERYLRKGFIEADKSLPETLEGKIVTVLDAATDPRVQFQELAQQEHIASIMSAPVRVKGDLIGSLRVYSRTRREFTSREQGFLATVANLAGIVLEPERHIETQKRPIETQTPYQPIPTNSPLKPAVFAHPSEEEFAKLLDFYQIEWLYEPRSFPLQWQEDKITEMFTPDFYLPGLDLHIEMTTLKPGIPKEKKQRIRRLQELYPEINVKLLARHDYDRLLAKYGHGPLSGSKTRGVGRVFLSTAQIQRKVQRLAKEISHDYEGRHPIMVGVMRGVFCFMADLMRYLTVPADVDFLALSYYGTEKSGAVRITKSLDMDPEGRHLLLVEDIVDTGMTLRFVVEYLRALNPASLAVCALLDKKVHRLADVQLTYVGFEVPDEFLIGYGLDYREEYRNLPFVALLKDERAEGDPAT